MPKTRFHSLLEAKIRQAMEPELDAISSGLCKDYPHYREQVGYLRGLNDALRLCDDIEEDLSQ